jgi:hypothetical protein
MRNHFPLLAFGLFVASAAACSSAQSQDHSSGVGSDSGADSSVSHGSEAGSDTGADSSVDSGTADSMVPLGEGGPSLCNHGGAFLFCDGFEDTNLSDNWSQPSYGNAPPPQADSVHYYRGTHALHARTYAVADAGTSAYSTVQKLASSGWPAHVFTRLFVYQPSPNPPSPEGFLDLINTSSPYAGIELLSNPSGGLATFTYNTSKDQGWTSDAGLPLDEWVCFEVEVDTFNSVSHVYMNDVEMTALAGTKLALPALGNVSVGMSFFSAAAGQGQEDAWIDEVAVSTSRIGCSN